MLRDAGELCEDIFTKCLTLVAETTGQSIVPPSPIFNAVSELYRWVVFGCEKGVQSITMLKGEITEVAKDRMYEHGMRYEDAIKVDTFWDEKQLQMLKDAERGACHTHPTVDGITNLLNGLRTNVKRSVKEQIE